MALKIRLRRQGRKNRPFYRLVVAGETRPRDGAYVETVGTYNPFEESGEEHLKVDAERVEYWLGQGAQLTEKAEALVNRGAPTVLRAYKEKALAKQAKETARKREARKKKAASK